MTYVISNKTAPLTDIFFSELSALTTLEVDSFDCSSSSLVWLVWRRVEDGTLRYEEKFVITSKTS